MDLNFDETFETKSGEHKMEQNQNMQGKLIDTTDSLEAVGVMRCWKNFLFTIVILGLLLSQLSFWLVNTNIIKTEEQPTEESIVVATKNAYVPVIDAEENAIKAGEVRPAETKTKKTLAFLRKIDFEELSWLIKFVNFALLLTAFLYCLSMMFILKVSLVGRLGGINHITRAFFLSLTFVVLLFPWQLFFKEVVAGAMYMPGELLEGLKNAKDAGIMGQIYLYLRYCVYWVIVLLLAISSQIRSGRWARASLRRLEVV